MNLEQTVEWVKGKLPSVPDPAVEMKVLDEDSVLTGNTKIEKVGDALTAKITIAISKNLLSRPNIEAAVKAVLVHEFCHLADPFHPDEVMKEHFPSIWEVWKKAKQANALECDATIEELRFR